MNGNVFLWYLECLLEAKQTPNYVNDSPRKPTIWDKTKPLIGIDLSAKIKTLCKSPCKRQVSIYTNHGTLLVVHDMLLFSSFFTSLVTIVPLIFNKLECYEYHGHLRHLNKGMCILIR
jgi:hypothetical protein